MKPKYSHSFQITLSAISCAMAVLFLYVGTFNPYLLATGYFMGAVCLCVPLSKNFYRGDFLAYLGTVVLTVIMGAVARIWVLVPFIMFFGLHPLANALLKKYKVPYMWGLIAKIVWFDATAYVAYLLVFNGFIGGENAVVQFANDHILLVIAVVGSLFLVAYDYAMAKAQKVINGLVARIRK